VATGMPGVGACCRGVQVPATVSQSVPLTACRSPMAPQVGPKPRQLQALMSTRAQLSLLAIDWGAGDRGRTSIITKGRAHHVPLCTARARRSVG
jgi:hypothetical protein